MNLRTNRFRLSWLSSRQVFSLTHPPFVKGDDIHEFLNKNKLWIQKVLAHSAEPNILSIGDTFCFFGERLALKQDFMRKKGVWKVGADLIVGRDVTSLQPLMESALKKEAEKFFQQWSQHYAGQLQTQFSKISIRDGRSRWGSCSQSGTLSYSWRLGFAPLEIAKYVCAHEVAHLQEMNHSPSFWALVGDLDPSYKKHRAWLKKEGGKLKSISFAIQETLENT